MAATSAVDATEYTRSESGAMSAIGVRPMAPSLSPRWGQCWGGERRRAFRGAPRAFQGRAEKAAPAFTMKAESYAWPPAAGGGHAAAPAAANPWGDFAANPPPAGAAARGAPPQKSGGGAPEDSMSLAQLQERHDHHEQAIAESQQRMLRLAATTTEVGATTLNQLHQQGDKLRHIQAEQAKVDENLKTSDKLLTGMESLRGAIKNSISSWWSGSRPASARGEKPCASAAPPASAPPSSGAGTARNNPFRAPQASAGAPAQAQAAAPAEDDAMARIAGLVDGLHAQALAMNGAIKEQGSLLDGTIASAEEHNGKLQKNNRRANKLLGR
jgi:synaptosomal-associated protein 25